MSSVSARVPVVSATSGGPANVVSLVVSTASVSAGASLVSAVSGGSAVISLVASSDCVPTSVSAGVSVASAASGGSSSVVPPAASTESVSESASAGRPLSSLLLNLWSLLLLVFLPYLSVVVWLFLNPQKPTTFLFLLRILFVLI